MFKNAQNSIALPFKNFQFCPHQHHQKIGHQCKRPHKPQDNSFAFSHKHLYIHQLHMKQNVQVTLTSTFTKVPTSYSNMNINIYCYTHYFSFLFLLLFQNSKHHRHFDIFWKLCEKSKRANPIKSLILLLIQPNMERNFFMLWMIFTHFINL